jgi:hypothetical protein
MVILTANLDRTYGDADVETLTACVGLASGFFEGIRSKSVPNTEYSLLNCKLTQFKLNVFFETSQY